MTQGTCLAKPSDSRDRTGLPMDPPSARVERARSLTRKVENVQIGCPDASWDAYVHAHPEGTIFHTRGWQRAVTRAFGLPVYDLHMAGEANPAGILPLYRVRSLLGGPMLVSVPYGVGGGALAGDACTREALIEAAIGLAGDLGVRAIDLRSQTAASTRLHDVNRYIVFRRGLPDRSEDVLPSIPRKARAEIRHARDRHRLEVRTGDEHLGAVWRLYCRNMRRLASINYPLRFFRTLIEELPRHRVSVVLRDGQPVAGLVSFVFRQSVLPYFYGASEQARQCGAAHFVYLELMEWAVGEGLRQFDFGRSRLDNAGSVDFKRLFGFEPAPLGYQRWTRDGREGADLTPSNPRLQWARKVWSILPLTLTTALGARLSKYVPG